MASRPWPPMQRRGSRTTPQEEQSHPTASSTESSNPAFVMNNPDTSTASPYAKPREPPTRTNPAEPGEPPDAPTCWICQQDATDDTPETSKWRRPCPCSLTAHDDCLLEWITSQEAPKPGEMATAQNIVCPVCQAPIKIDRPRDFVVVAADIVQRAAKTMMLPTALSAVIGCFYSGFLVYGLNTMQLVFGLDEAIAIMMPKGLDTRSGSGVSRQWTSLIKLSDPFLPTMPGLKHWKLFLGLPMIAPGLVLARTNFADQIFAILPVSYFVFHPTRRLNLTSWPPSPALTLAVLPYIRTTYNELYKYVFSDLEKRWDMAVQRKPREGETAEQIAAEQQGRRDQAGFLDIEVELVEEGEDIPDDEQQVNNVGGDDFVQVEQGGHGGPRDLQAVGDDLQALERAADQLEHVAADANAGEAPDRAHLPAQAEPLPAAGQANRDRAARRRPRPNGGWEIRQNLSTTQIVSNVMGALFFPAISSLMGDLLEATLPTRWVAKNNSRWGPKVSAGMLKEKWGRSIVGGCLFVVLKDAVTLYVKWKKARDFGKKRVLDYTGERRRPNS